MALHVERYFGRYVYDGLGGPRTVSIAIFTIIEGARKYAGTRVAPDPRRGRQLLAYESTESLKPGFYYPHLDAPTLVPCLMPGQCPNDLDSLAGEITA